MLFWKLIKRWLLSMPLHSWWLFSAKEPAATFWSPQKYQIGQLQLTTPCTFAGTSPLLLAGHSEETSKASLEKWDVLWVICPACTRTPGVWSKVHHTQWEEEGRKQETEKPWRTCSLMFGFKVSSCQMVWWGDASCEEGLCGESCWGGQGHLCPVLSGSMQAQPWCWTNSHRLLWAPEATPWWQPGKEALPGVWLKESFVPPTRVIFWLPQRGELNALFWAFLWKGTHGTVLIFITGILNVIMIGPCLNRETTLGTNFSHCWSLRNMLSLSLWTTSPLCQGWNSPAVTAYTAYKEGRLKDCV